MVVRKAELADAKGIAAVHVAAWQAAYRGLLDGDALDRLSVDDSEKLWCERITKPRGYIFVAEQEGRIVGFVTCESSLDGDVDPQKVGEIHVIHIHPEAWRQGHGTALMGEAIECLREEGFQEITLWVLQGNLRAMRFYKAMGFEADGASRVEQHAGFEMPVVRYRRTVWVSTDR